MSRRALAISSLVLFVIGGMAMEVDLDLWHAMALAREALRTGSIPLQDRFAYTPTVSPTMHHEWGMGFLLYGMTMLGGAWSLLAVRLVLVLAACWLVWRLAARRGASEASMVLLAPIAIVMSWMGWTLIRAQVVTLLFVAVLLYALDLDRQGRRRWILPWLAAFVVWVNCHAGFVVGLAAIVLEVVERTLHGERPWHLVAVALAMGALVSVNPYGPAYYGHLWSALGMDRSLIIEWRPIWFAGPPQVVLVALAVLIAVYGVVRLGPARALGWPLVAAVAYQGVRHQRQVSVFALVWFAQVPAWVSRTRLNTVLQRLYARMGSALWIGVAATGVLLAQRNEILHPRIEGTEGTPAWYAVGPVDWLREIGFCGNAIVPFETGAYVSWKLYPNVKVSLDSRYEAAYPPEALVEHLDFFDATPRWKEILAGIHGTDVVIMLRTAKVRELLAREPGWSIVYDDDAWVVFARPGLTLPYRDRRGEHIEGTFP